MDNPTVIFIVRQGLPVDAQLFTTNFNNIPNINQHDLVNKVLSLNESVRAHMVSP